MIQTWKKFLIYQHTCVRSLDVLLNFANKFHLPHCINFVYYCNETIMSLMHCYNSTVVMTRILFLTDVHKKMGRPLTITLIPKNQPRIVIGCSYHYFAFHEITWPSRESIGIHTAMETRSSTGNIHFLFVESEASYSLTFTTKRQQRHNIRKRSRAGIGLLFI